MLELRKSLFQYFLGRAKCFFNSTEMFFEVGENHKIVPNIFSSNLNHSNFKIKLISKSHTLLDFYSINSIYIYSRTSQSLIHSNIYTMANSEVCRFDMDNSCLQTPYIFMWCNLLALMLGKSTFLFFSFFFLCPHI